MRLGILWSLNSFLFFNICYAGVSVKGLLLEKGTRAILKETNVFLLPHKLKAISSETGEFIFPDVPEGKFSIIVNKSGYLKYEKNFETGKDANLKLYVERESYDVFETVVTGKEVKKDVTKKKLSQAQFLKAPGAQEDPVKAVQNLPGVANQSFSSEIVVQGSEPDDTRYTLDGHEIPLVFHFGGLTSVLNPKAVEEVEYLSAGYGPEYGRALGGIINLKSSAPRTERWYGDGFIDITKLGVMLDGPISDNSSLIASARVSYFGKIIEKAAEEMDDFAVTAAPEFQDYYLKYQKDISDTESLSILGISSKDTLGLIIKEGDDPIIEGNLTSETYFNRLIASYSKELDKSSSYNVSVATGQDQIDFNLGDQFFDLDIVTISTRAEFQKKINEKWKGFYGIDSQWRDFDLNIRFPSTSNEGGVNGTGGAESTFAEISGEYWENAVYLRHQYQYNEKFLISPNIRYEYFTAIEEGYVSPRINGTYEISSDLKFNFAYGDYYQAPQNGEGSDEFGNPDVKAEKSTHYYISLEKDFREGSSQGLQLEGGLFYKELDDLIVSTSETKSDGTPLRTDNKGTGKVHGMQIQGNYKIDEYTIVLSYTYMKSRRTDLNYSDYPSEFDQTHNLNLIGVYERSRWSFSTRFRYVTGGPYTPINGSIYNSDTDVYIPTKGEFYSERFDDFLQLDFRIDRKFIYNEWILSAYLDIQNLTNANNGQGISYNYDYSDSEKAAGTPVIPIIGVRGEF